MFLIFQTKVHLSFQILSLHTCYFTDSYYVDREKKQQFIKMMKTMFEVGTNIKTGSILITGPFVIYTLIIRLFS